MKLACQANRIQILFSLSLVLRVVCRFFKEDPLIASTDTEVLLKESVCIAQRLGVTAAGPEEAVPEPGEAEMQWTKPS
jgi:hypothetical protein